MREICRGLRFPEGPVAMADGSVLLVEIERGTLSRVEPDGRVEVVAECGGGPNGAALGPDGRIYLCNNGGFEWMTVGGILRPTVAPGDYAGGSIQAVDLALRYDPRLLKVVDVQTAGIAKEFKLLRNDLDGELRLALFGLEPWEGSGVVLRIAVKLDGVLTNDALAVEAQFNEGRIPLELETRLEIAASTDDRMVLGGRR